MPITALLLLFASASLHALWNLLLKHSREKYITMGWMVLLGGVLSGILLLFTGLPPRSMWGYIAASVALETIYFILLSSAYTDHDFSLIYPVARGTAPAFLMIWSTVFLKEDLTRGGILGILLIVGGMIVIGTTSLGQTQGRRVRPTGIFTALTVALIISLYTFVDGSAVQDGSPLPYALTMFALVPVLTTAYNLRRYGGKRFLSAWKGPRLPLVIASVLGVTAYLLALFAYTIAPVGYSGAIREMSVVIGAFLGWQYLGEEMGGRRVLGSVIIFAGILTIALFG